MKILYLQTHYGFPNSRVQKEIYALGKEHEVHFLGWNREISYTGIRLTKIKIQDKYFLYSLLLIYVILHILKIIINYIIIKKSKKNNH